MMSDATSTTRDLSQKPLSFMLGWGMPILVLLSMNFARGIIPYHGIVAILAGTLAWMGIGCLINARRCGRRHCYLAAPILLAGAIGVLFVAYDIIDLGADGLNIIVWGTGLLVGLTFVPEWIWGKYRRS